MKKTLLFVLLLTCVFTLSGCGKTKDKEKTPAIVGKWAYNSYVYTFNKDKSCTYDVAGTLMKCTYEIDGDNISILYDGSTAPFKTTYEIKDNKLNIKDSLGNDTIYEKK